MITEDAVAEDGLDRSLQDALDASSVALDDSGMTTLSMAGLWMGSMMILMDLFDSQSDFSRFLVDRLRKHDGESPNDRSPEKKIPDQQRDQHHADLRTAAGIVHSRLGEVLDEIGEDPRLCSAYADTLFEKVARTLIAAWGKGFFRKNVGNLVEHILTGGGETITVPVEPVRSVKDAAQPPATFSPRFRLPIARTAASLEREIDIPSASGEPAPPPRPPAALAILPAAAVAAPNADQVCDYRFASVGSLKAVLLVDCMPDFEAKRSLLIAVYRGTSSQGYVTSGEVSIFKDVTSPIEGILEAVGVGLECLRSTGIAAGSMIEIRSPHRLIQTALKDAPEATMSGARRAVERRLSAFSSRKIVTSAADVSDPIYEVFDRIVRTRIS